MNSELMIHPVDHEEIPVLLEEYGYHPCMALKQTCNLLETGRVVALAVLHSSFPPVV
jgi:hypothetical protein